MLTGDAIDIRKFPAQRMWPLDGGKYLGTGDAVVTKCPETGRINVGTYRMMIKGPREVGVYTSPGKDATLDREKWWKLGKPMPIAACYGIDPLLFLVAATSLPKTECEYDYYSGIAGAPIELFTGDVTGLPLPSRAEIILEGFLYPDETFAEGPFGEFTGYYGRPSGATPYMRVEKVRYRDNPTLTCALMADGPSNECGLFWAALRSAGIWADLQKLGVPGIQGVWSIPEAAGWGMTVVSIKQMYAGHAPQVMALAAQCTAGAYFGKYVIVVDEDIDPTNVGQVLWAMATRSRPSQSIDILRETWSTFLDPSLNPPEIRPWGSKALINACMDYKHIKTFSKRTKLAKKTYDAVVARWRSSACRARRRWSPCSRTRNSRTVLRNVRSVTRPRGINVDANGTAGRPQRSARTLSRCGSVMKERENVLSNDPCRLLARLRVCSRRSRRKIEDRRVMARAGRRLRRRDRCSGLTTAPAVQSNDARPDAASAPTRVPSPPRQASVAVCVRRTLCRRRRWRRAADIVCGKRLRPAGRAGHHQPSALLCAALYRADRGHRR